MTVTNLYYKDVDNLYRTSITYPLSEWIESNPITEYYVLTDNSFDSFTDCLVLENGVLSYDLALLKEAVQQVRKVKCQELFKPYDKVFESINALEIPESEFNATHAELKTTAEEQRIIIRDASEAQKNAINNATTAEAVFAIHQEIINS